MINAQGIRVDTFIKTENSTVASQVGAAVTNPGSWDSAIISSLAEDIPEMDASSGLNITNEPFRLSTTVRDRWRRGRHGSHRKCKLRFQRLVFCFSRKVAFPFLHDRVRMVVCELICMPHNRLPTFPVMGGPRSFRPRDGDPGVWGA